MTPTITMPGRKQLERRATIRAPLATVYGLFTDNHELANWAPVVDALVHEQAGDGDGVGTRRTCAVTMNGKAGTMVEECVEAVPETRASFRLVEDSFGFTRLLKDYGFTAHFTGVTSSETAVRLETFYTPVNTFAAVVNSLILRPRFAAVVDGLLAGLGSLAEHRHQAGE